MDELYRSENVVVRRVPAADLGRWVVTFDNYSIGHGFDREGFGESFLQNHGISAIHVMGRREDWYQYPEMAEAMAAVRQAVQGAQRVMTYGSSMGAYAAIRFADAAGAQAVLALSPQYSIDPAKAPFEQRWRQDSRRIQWLPHIDGPIRSAVRPVIVYDPTGDDRRHVDLIGGDIAVTTIRLPYADHPVSTYLAELGLLQPLLFGVLDGTADAAAIQRQARASRRNSVVYLVRLADQQPASRLHTAIALARQAMALSPNNPSALAGLARQLTRAGDHIEALELHRRVAELTDRYFVHLIGYANALAAVGETSAARAVAREILASPEADEMSHLHAWESAILWEAGAHEEARESVRAAMLRDPMDEQYRRLLDYYDRRLAPANEIPPSTPWRKVRRWAARLLRA